MAMANILQSLGNAMERQQQRRHENNMEVLRAIYTRPGMIVLGVILLGAALALICNLIARMPGFEGALPVNSVTALVGAPVVASVLFRKRKNELNE